MSLKIIVCYASAGSGHSRAAQAVYHYLTKNYPELSPKLVDILDYTNLLFANLYSHGYSLLVSHLTFVWAIGYHLTKVKCICRFFNFICRLNCLPFRNLLIKEQPDVVLATHFFPAEMVACLKRKKRLNSRLVMVVTDFGSHAFWILRQCDDYIVGSDSTRSHFIAQGINQEKIKVMGIPIRSGFSIGRQKNKSGEEFTALLITGSFGFSLIERAVEMLFSEIKLLVVCGRNQRLYKRLERKGYSTARLFGFVEDISELMRQADIIITKPGGSTIAEALAMELPLIFIKGIPGQETENARILEDYGCATISKDLKSLRDAIINLKTHPETLELMRTNIRKIRNPDATRKICQYITKDVRSGSA